MDHFMTQKMNSTLSLVLKEPRHWNFSRIFFDVITFSFTDILFFRRIKKKLGANKKTTEAIEIERIKELQQETKKRLKENQTFLHKALAPKPIQQQKADTELTRTVEFSFATDSRLKQHPMKTRSEEGTNGKKFSEQLRKHPRSPVSFFFSFKNC